MSPASEQSRGNSIGVIIVLSPYNFFQGSVITVMKVNVISPNLKAIFPETNSAIDYFAINVIIKRPANKFEPNQILKE